MGHFPVKYDSRVIIYARKIFIRLATGHPARLFDDLCSHLKAQCLYGQTHESMAVIE